MTALLRYDAACRAIAEAKSFDEVQDWIDKAAAVKEYTRRIKNRALELDAIEIRARAKRRRGELLLQLKDDGKIRLGKRSSTDDLMQLEDLGVSKNESSEEQALARLPEDSFAGRLAAWRMFAEAHPEKHSFDLLKVPPDGPVRGARAIMGSRVEPADSLDYFPTPPWATRALLADVFPALGVTGSRRQAAWEPACGEGHIAEVLREHFRLVRATDIHEYGYGDTADFLGMSAGDADWIITNPPFGEKTEAFVLRALDLARVGVAMFVRMQWLETIGRYERLFRDRPPTLISFFCERVNLCKGRWDPDGTTATAYIWLVWMRGRLPRAPFWIPPGRREALSKADDRERFTAQPVAMIDHPADADGAPLDHDNETGEILDEPTGSDGPALATTPPADPNAPHPLDIPAFLRRRAPEGV